MLQAARHLTDGVDGFLLAQRFFICDRDQKFTARFRRHLEDAGVEVVRTPYRAPNCNAYAERFVRSIKDECLDRMILFGEPALVRALREFVAHYHAERNHQGIDNELIERSPPSSQGSVVCRERLGGLLQFYERAA